MTAFKWGLTAQRTGAPINPCVQPRRATLQDIGEQLARLYNSTLEEPLPPDIEELLKGLR